MSQEFIEKYNNEISRIIFSLTTLFALLIGFNIGSGAEISNKKILLDRIVFLENEKALIEKHYEKELLDSTTICDQKINDVKLFEKQTKEKAFEDYKIVCQQMKCQGTNK